MNQSVSVIPDLPEAEATEGSIVDDSTVDTSRHYLERLMALDAIDAARADFDCGPEKGGLPRFTEVREKLLPFFAYIYGSNKNAIKAFEQIRDFIQPINPAYNWRVKGACHGLCLLKFIESDIHNDGLSKSMPGFPHPDLMPSTAVMKHAYSLVGGEDHSSKTEVDGTALGVAKAVERHWPFMARIHNRGEFSWGISNALLLLASFRDRLSSKEPLQGVERNCLLVAAQIILGAFSVRLKCLIGLYFPALNKALDFKYTFAGFTYEVVTPEFDIWEVAPDELDVTVEMFTAFRLYADVTGNDDLDNDLVSAERSIIASHGAAQTLDLIVRDFTKNKLRPVFDQMNEFFTTANAFKASSVQLTFQLPPEGLTLNISSIRDLATLSLLTRKLIAWIEDEFDHVEVLTECESRMKTINEAQDRIQELNNSRSVKALLEIAELAENAKNLILSNQDWYTERLTAFNAYVLGAFAIIKEISVLNTACGAATAKPSASMPKVAAPAPVPAPSSIEQAAADTRVVELEAELRSAEDQLTTALADVEHLDAELKEKKVEIHKLRSIVQGLPSANQQLVPAPSLDPELVNRVVLRSNLSATDVLKYFASIAPDRVCVLPNAYDSASGHAETPASIERMLDLLQKAIFPYLDSINGGTADTEARKIFGTKSYSAKESESTLQNNRMGALRDFDYQGKSYRIERHLRISNGTGKDGMRLYFDIIGGKVVIAYAGPHLDVPSSS